MPITRRRRDQLSLVDQSKSRNTRAGWPSFACDRRSRLVERVGDARLKPRVARQAEHVVDLVGLAPGHQGLAGKAGIGAQHDLHPRPARADLRHDARHLLDRPGAAVDVRAPQLRRQKMPAAEHVKRQIAVAVVVAVKEPAFLLAVQRIVGGVEVEHDLARRLGVRVEKQLDEQPSRSPPRRGRSCDSAAALPAARRMLQAVQRALARQRRRRLAVALELAEQHAQNRIAAKFIVVVEVLIAQRQAEDALRDQRLERMHGHKPDCGGRAKQAANRSISPIALSVSPSSNAPASDDTIPPSKSATTRRPPALPNSDLRRATLRLHRGAPSNRRNSLITKQVYADSRPRCA